MDTKSLSKQGTGNWCGDKVMRTKGLILLVILGSMVFAAKQTWHLKDGQEWQPVGQEKDSGYMLAVSDAKQFVSTGKTGKAKNAFAKLKKDYPQLAGADFDAFVKAELLYSQRKYEKASEAYDKFTDDFPQSAFYLSALERQYQIGTAFLGGQKKRALGVISITAYDEGGAIMNKIADKAGDAPIAKNALQTLAQSDEKRGAYYDSYLVWSDMSNRWPTGPVGQDALLGMARTLEKDYRGPKFDGKVLESSRSYYSEYQKRYEDKAAELQIPQKLGVIDEKLAEKEMTVADYYARTGSYNAANLYYQRITEVWPSSVAAKSAEQKIPVMKKEQEKLLAQSMLKKKKFNWRALFL
ncbi:MAG: tetratricopeptide repeat protein [Sedimentisphaerales bacterium]